MAQLERLTGELEYKYSGGGLKAAIGDLGNLDAAAGGMAQRSGLAMGGLKVAGMAAGAAIAGVGIAAVGAGVGIAKSVGAAMDFEASLSGIKAVSGSTAAEMELVSQKALQIGADTSFSAQEAANAIGELVKGGVSVTDVLAGAADATVALAAAGELAMPEAAAIMTAAMNTFGQAASELPHSVDMIAASANVTSMSVGDFGMAMNQVAVVADAVGFSFDDTALSITALGKAGLKGSDAGTSLKTMFMNLIPQTKAQFAEFSKLGLLTEENTSRFFDQEGKVKSAAEVAGLLKEAYAGMTEEQVLASQGIIFGSDAIRASTILTKAGAEGVDELATSMGKISAADVAKERLNNLTGSVEAFWGSLETLQIKLGLAFTPMLKVVTDFGTGVLNSLGPVLDELTPMIEGAFADFDIGALMSGGADPSGALAPVFDAISGLRDSLAGVDWAGLMDGLIDGAKSAGPVIVDLAAGLIDLITFLVDHRDIILTVGTAFAAFSVLSTIVPIVTTLAAAFGTITTVLSAGGGIITAVGAGLAALGGPLAAIGAAVAGGGGLTGALTALVALLGGPVTVAIAAIAGIIAIWTTDFMGVRTAVTDMASGVVDSVNGLWDSLSSVDIGGTVRGWFGGGEAEAAAADEGAAAAAAFAAAATEGGAALSALGEQMSGIGGGAGVGIVDGLRQALEGFADSDAPGLATRIADGLARVGGDETPPFLAKMSLALRDFQEGFELEPDMSWLENVQNGLANTGETGQTLADGIQSALGDIDLPDMPDIDLSPLTDPFTEAWSSIQSGIDSAWASFDSTIQTAQDAIYDYLLDIWMQIPEDIRADLVLIAEHIREQFEQYRADIEEKLTEAKDSIQSWLADVKRQWDTWLADTVQTARDAWADVKAAIMEPLLEAKADLASAWASVQAEAAAAWARVQQVIQDAVARALAVLSDVRAQIEQRARDAWAGVVTAATTALAPLVAAVTERVNAAISYLTGIRDTVSGKAREIWDGFVKATQAALSRFKDVVLTPIRAALDGLRTTITEAATRAGDIGRGIVDGIKKGLDTRLAALKSSFWDSIRGILDWLKGLLGIASPSRVFAEIGMAMMLGMAVGIADGTGAVLDALATSAGLIAAAPFAGLVTGDDPDMSIAKAIAEMGRLSDEYDRLADIADDVNGRDLLAAPIRRMNDALSAFFDGGAAGSLSDLLRMMGEGGFSPDQASLLERLGFSERSFEEIQRAIEALAGEPEKQARLWGDFIDGLMSGWDEFYRAQKAPLEEQKRALELLKKAAERDPNRVGTEYDPAIEAIQAQLDAWEARNDAIQRGLDGQDMTLDGILAAYKRIKDAVEATNDAAEDGLKALEAARKLAEDAIKRREDSALGAEEGAHDETMAMLDAEARARERQHKARMRAMDEQQKALEADVAAALADEERLHKARMAAITAQVDARDAELDAEETLLDKAKMYLDLLSKGGTLTGEQKDLLRSLGIDPDTAAKTNAELAETTKRLDQMKRIYDQLPDERGRVRQGGGEIRTEAGKQIGDKGATFTDADRGTLEAALASGKIADKDRRIVEVFLAGGVVQARRLRQILGPLIEKDAAAIEAAGKQVDLADDLLGRREAQLKIDRQIAEEAREALAGQLSAEEAAHEAFVKDQEARVTAFEARRDAIEAAYDAEREAIAEAKAAEEDRHDARMKAIRDEYALQLLTLGKTDAEIAAILDEMARRQATITAEAQARFEKIMRDAEAIRAANAAPPIPVMGGDPNRQAKRQGGGARPGDHPIVLPPLGPDYMNTFDQTNAGLATFGDLLRDVSAAMATAAPFLPAIAAGAGGGAGGGGGNRDLTNYGLITVGDQGAGNREFAAALMEFLGL